MEKFKFSLALIALIFFLPDSSGEISITANGEENIIFVDSGQNVTFSAIGTENATSVLWDFGIDINGPNTRYSNLTEVAVSGLKKFIEEVKSENFPDEDHSYNVDNKELEKFKNLVEKRKQI